MEIKLFGKELFSINKKKGGVIYNTAIDAINKSAYLPDFHKDTGGSSQLISELNDISTYTITNISSGAAIVGTSKKGKKVAKKAKTAKQLKAEERVKLTPKGVFELKMLNDEVFKVNVDPVYVNEQIEAFRDKLGMIKSQEFDMNRGTIEISSVLTRMENRKKYEEHKEFYEEFPYTTTTRINELTKTHDYLKLGEVSQFLADMPKDAVDVMKRYTEATKALCGKKPVFYIIADKKDFQKSQQRRDPILLAQSPFGHFWQILGAWDKEMLLIEEL